MIYIIRKCYRELLYPIFRDKIRKNRPHRKILDKTQYYREFKLECIRKSRNMIPVYKKYTEKEFTIIGVAREFENTSKLEKALNREEFPWKNLVDLDDKYNIWRKYDIPFSGGGMFLIGKNGKILAINPSAKEVEKYYKIVYSLPKRFSRDVPRR